MAELKLTIDANKALRDRVEVRTAERDAAVAHLRAVLDWSNTERFAGRTRHENDAPSSARSFLDGLDELQTSPKTSKDLDLCDECGCIGLCDPRCSLVPVQQDEPGACEHIWVPSGEASRCYSCNAVKCPVPVQQDAHPSELDPLRHIAHDCKCNHVPVQQDEPEGVCAFPNCSCTENRCPAKGERGPFCDHGFHPRLCGRCAPVPEAVTDEDEVQCQMCKTVQPRPDKECGHCGAGPKYLCPIHTRPAAVPVQQEPEGLLMCSSFSGGPTNERCTKDAGHTGLHEGEMLRWSDGPRPLLPGCKTCGAATGETCHEDCPQQLAVAAVPSVGLRDRVACELANLEYERSGRLCETEDFYADADRVLSVLHEAGTQEDGLDALARQFKNGQTVVWGDGPHQQGTVVGFCYTIPEQAGGPDRPALVVKDHWSDRTGHVLPSELIAAPAVSGTPDTKEDEA